MGYAFSFWTTVILMAVVIGVMQGACAYLTLLERKIAAWTQDRYGPNRVGPLGLIQPIADGLKFLLKEQVIPHNVDKLFYLLGPGIALSTAMLAFSVVPFGPTQEPATRPWPQTIKEERAFDQANPGFAREVEKYNDTLEFVIAPHVDIGIVFVFAVGSLAVYAIILGGWSSNNKYSLLGGLRSSAQLISYEIPMGMAVLGVMLVTGSLNVERIIHYQHAHGWNVLYQPLAALLFVTSIFAECNRVPFDLPECEQELVGGYHTEYSGMKFALFFLGEYTHVLTTSFLAVALFFGGWLLPGLSPYDTGIGSAILKVVVFGGKVFLFILFYMLIRWTLPRFRFDQLMGLNWKLMMPLALVNLVCVLIVKQLDLSMWWMLPVSVLVFLGSAWVTLQMPREPARARRYRLTQDRGHPVLTPDEIGI
jgi:NADH-quinone oxidoreductase subunit H